MVIIALSMIKRASLVVMLLLLPAFVWAGGVYHTVGKGETLWRICYTYEADLKEVCAVNSIKDPTSIKAGMRVFIPGAQKVLKVEPFPASPSPGKGGGDVPAKKGKFLWPVKGKVLKPFGAGEDGTRHRGIEILPPKVTAIKAADAGSVVYADGSLKGYGNVVIIRHDGDFYTVYAKNAVTSVKEGDTVSRGEVIGTTGQEGLYFEVRKGKNPLNPLFFLP